MSRISEIFDVWVRDNQTLDQLERVITYEYERLESALTAAESRGREAALKEAAEVARNACAADCPDGACDNPQTSCNDCISERILSLLFPANEDTGEHEEWKRRCEEFDAHLTKREE